MKTIIFALVAVAAFTSSALAGPQYVDKTGFAISGYDVVAYFGLPRSQGKALPANAVPGKRSIVAEYNGAKWAFANEENKKKFLADPAKYVPQYDGHCAYGVSVGGKVPANPNLWKITDGKLYLNITKVVYGFWTDNVSGHIRNARKNWSKLEKKAASKRVVPSFSTAKAPI